MRIWLINQYYYPDIAATAQLCADLAEDLVHAGHQVTVVAGTAHYRTPHNGDRRLPPPHLPFTEVHRGVRILRVPVLAAASGIVGRAAGYGSFLGAALVRVLGPLVQQRPDVVLALSTPPLVAALGLVLQVLRGVRFVYWVQDVYPELAIRLGVMKADGGAARGFAALSALLYRRADAVVALDETMAAALVTAGAPRARVSTIDNWCDGREVYPTAAADNRLRQLLGWCPKNAEDDQTQLTIGYAGNLGLGHDFATLAAALPLLRDDPVRFVFIGDGPQLPALQAQVAANPQALPPVRFLPPQTRALVRDALAAGDVGLVTLAKGLEGLLVPSKVYGMMAAGRPMLYVGPPQGRVAELLQEEDIGESVRNGDVNGLVAAVRRMIADPARRREQGQRARALFETRFDRPLATRRHESLLRQVGGEVR